MKGAYFNLYRNGSVIAHFFVYFAKTGNTTVYQIADALLKNGLKRSNKATYFGGMQVDPSHVFLIGKKVTLKWVDVFHFLSLECLISKCKLNTGTQTYAFILRNSFHLKGHKI